MIPCTAFRIEPDRTSGNGNITIDGEKIEYGPVQGEIFPGIARIMIPNSN
jgi:sphingosine kinase